MSDIAQILGLSGKPLSDTVVPAPAAPPPAHPIGYQPPKAVKMQGLPQEVVNILGGSSGKSFAAASMDLPMSVPTFPITNNTTAAATSTTETKPATDTGAAELVKVGNKFISIAKPARKWTWAPFSSSARTDGAIFYHWVRANVEYVDYPYARFDIHLDPVTYNDDEYKSYLQSDSWSRSQTDFLMDLARRFELRWPVIHDRWMEAFGIDCSEKIEDLQHRYYYVASKLNATRIAQEAAKEVQSLVASSAAAAANPAQDNKVSPEAILMETAAARALASSELEHQPPIASLGTGSSNKMFDIEYERQRRAHMEALWNRSKEDEAEEIEIRKELKLVEAQLRKMKKSGRHVLAAAAKGIAAGAAGAGAAATALPGIDPVALDLAFGSTAPKPVPQVPYLQSGRLVPPATGGPAGLNKTLLTRMDEVLAELKVPSKPIATKRVCDIYDQVRRDVLTLLVCQKQVIQKEGVVQSRRLRLAKMGGEGRVVDEETLLGITPAVPVASSPVARSKTKPSGSASKVKAAPGSGTGGVSSSSGKSKAPRPAQSSSSAVPLAPKPDASASATKTGEKDKDPSKASAKKAVKRKRKPDGAPATAAAAPVATGLPPGVQPATAPAVAPSANPSRPEDGTAQAKKRPKKTPTTTSSSS